MLKYLIKMCRPSACVFCVLGVYLTHGQVHVVSFSQRSEPVQTSALIIALQTLNQICELQMKETRVRL